MDVSESECNIVHETLSQNNSSDVPTYVITELKDDEHIKPSVTDKGSSYFSIFECGRNVLDQLNVTYQRAFTSSPLQQGLYQISPARERYYDMMVNNIIEKNVGSEGAINDEELCKAVTILKSEEEAGHECNIDNMTQEDDYKSPWKDKDATMVNNTLDDTAFTFFNSFQDDTSDSSKQVETSKEPTKYTQTRKDPITDTHIVDRVSYLQDGTTLVVPSCK